jgi:hypothetical protein
MKCTAALAVLVVAAGLTAATASAATTVVPLAPCVFTAGGHWSVPAGSDVVVRVGWAERRGLVEQFLDAVTVGASVDGVPVADTAQYWGPIDPSAGTPGFFVSQWRYDVGTLANAGDHVTVGITWTLANAVRTTVPVGWYGPGVVFDGTCTITASP